MKLIFIAAAANGLAYPSGVIQDIKDEKKAKDYLDKGFARRPTEKELKAPKKENAASKTKKETAAK